MKDLKIEIPRGYVVDEENSNLSQGIIKFKQVEIKTFDDLIKSKQKVNGYWIDDNSDIQNGTFYKMGESDKNVFIDKKHAKSALAMAQISQLMPFCGGAITDKEWEDKFARKFKLYRYDNHVEVREISKIYNFLSFRSVEQAKDFLKYNKRLVKDYLMID